MAWTPTAQLEDRTLASGHLPAHPFSHANFSQLPEVLPSAGIERGRWFLADLGVSTINCSIPVWFVVFRAMIWTCVLGPELPKSRRILSMS